MIERFPDDIGYQTGLAEIFNELGYVYYKRLDYPDALAAFQEVQQICHSLLEQIKSGPKPVRVLDWLARSYYNMATIQLRLDQKEPAIRSLEQSLRHRRALVAAHPSVTSFLEDLGEIIERSPLSSRPTTKMRRRLFRQSSRANFREAGPVASRSRQASIATWDGPGTCSACCMTKRATT